MGVAGCGKSTIGHMLAEKLNRIFMDADDFHPEANKNKMASGIPLNDEDRFPWLTILHDQLVKTPKGILACSALKATYRTILDPNHEYHWFYLRGSEELILQRLQQRKGHFMKPEMLRSQFETLEIPTDAITIEIENQPARIVDEIISKLNP